ncbi:hypothetical protein LDENG_00070960 [Lucifuga dentata]|nr:hypothetical protein LDENG_00070960 [Lucifuga dentata]
MCSTAIHIEMLDDLTTATFINTLHIFIAICGNVRQKNTDQEQLKEFGCEFVMNSPSSSHMGGQNRTIRSVLTAVLDQSAKRLDMMAIVNSRPLTTEHLNDPTSLEPFTPNHILTMKSNIISPPPGEFVSQDLYLHKRWRQVQFLANKFWTRWKKEYLLNLQQKQIWHKDNRNAKVNDIVILQEDDSPHNQ